ncbi:hypothetical protein MTO98_22135 [Mucilaginibacter sp. SMC90]|uniref:hypothetical protein n=1 Tax=Mucilaginibacter sp. SMC90 TaxID=2929803 RepID=UPI001FB545AA|nr:hypothetical protein [Mucilaginibacter sp. SMC90]UOE47107.1 hypothetical protein MTO98_22135 [Mucilaginibacter sp. SMC90]
MELRDDELRSDELNRPENEENKPNAYRVDDDNNEEEKDLKRSFLFGNSEMKSPDDEGMEGKGMGGHNFGQNNITPAGNDKDNPSQMAGNNNEYFNRTQPAEEHPENSNFKDPNQAGNANYGNVINVSQNGRSDESEGQTETNDKKPNAQQQYEEGTADDDGDSESKQQTNIPGPNEVPDQQKVGE